MEGRGEGGGEGEGEIFNGENILFGGGGGWEGDRGRGRGNEEGGRGRRGTESSFGFPIIDEEKNATMKNISPSVLPKFLG